MHRRGQYKLFTANKNHHPKIRCESVFCSGSPLLFTSLFPSNALPLFCSVSLSLSPLSIFGVPAKFSMIFPFERDKERDEREGERDGWREIWGEREGAEGLREEGDGGGRERGGEKW